MKIYHHNDHDGRCGAAIALRYATTYVFAPETHQVACSSNGSVNFDKIETIEIDYNERPVITNIELDEKIAIIDYSFLPEDMEQVLQKTKFVVWIDHHRTAFELENKYSEPIDGFRSEKYSGCELAWAWYCSSISMPLAVKLIGDRDKWAWKMGELTAPFNEGLKLYNCCPKSQIWTALFGEKGEQWVGWIATKGEICLQYRNTICKDYVEKYGFETEFEGHKAFAVGLLSFGSDMFGEKIKEYPLCLSFETDGKSWMVGLYSEIIDVGQLAVIHKEKNPSVIRAGGHKGAAGYNTLILPEFVKIH